MPKEIRLLLIRVGPYIHGVQLMVTSVLIDTIEVRVLRLDVHLERPVRFRQFWRDIR